MMLKPIMSNSERTQHRVDEIQALIDVSRLVTVVDLDKVLIETLLIVANAVSATKGSLFLLNEKQQPYQRFITQRNMPPEVSKVVVSKVLNEGLAGWCVREKRGTIVADTSTDKRWLIFDDDPQTDVRSVICVPFMYEDRVHAVMTLVNEKADHFTRQDLQLATAIANQASSAIRNAHLFDDIQRQQSQLDIVLENAGELIFMLDASFNFQQANSQVAVMLDKSRDNLIGSNYFDLPDHLFWRQLGEFVTKAKESSTNQSIELRNETSQQDFSISISCVYHEKETSFVVVLHDITVMKDLDRLKSHMIRMASHDLKNPLGIMMGYVELIRNDVSNEMMPDIELVDGAMRAIKKMDKLIEELLDAKRLERETQYRKALVNTENLITQAVAEFEQQLAKKKIELVDKTALELPPIAGDGTQLRQAMINLISNAIKYTPTDGIIAIHASADGNRFHFSVEDSGIGIPENMQEGIFNQLYRAMRPEIEDIKGTGFGLSLVKEIIERHNGQVWFRSREGEGSVFGFWVPIQASN